MRKSRRKSNYIATVNKHDYKSFKNYLFELYEIKSLEIFIFAFCAVIFMQLNWNFFAFLLLIYFQFEVKNS